MGEDGKRGPRGDAGSIGPPGPQGETVSPLLLHKQFKAVACLLGCNIFTLNIRIWIDLIIAF